MRTEESKQRVRRVKIGLVGFGVVGQGVYSILESSAHRIFARRGFILEIKKIAVLNLKKERAISFSKELLTDQWKELVDDPEIEVIVELVGGVEFPFHLICEALSKKKHIVTANKALLALQGEEIFRSSAQVERGVGFEASVAGGIPIIRTIKEALSGDEIHSIYGIVNGTSNYILTQMIDRNQSLAESLKQAQKLGFAEADPTLDLNGEDAAHKMAILASFAFNTAIPYSSISYEGIENLELVDLAYAKELGYTVKLLGLALQISEHRISVRVHPSFIPLESPMAGIKNEFNAILLDSHFLGKSIYTGLGSGMFPTAIAVVADLIDIAEHIVHQVEFNEHKNKAYQSYEMFPVLEMQYEYYLRFNTLDKPGILSHISGILGEKNISIAKVIQRGKRGRQGLRENFVHVVIETYRAKEKNMKEALEEIQNLKILDSTAKMFRIVRPFTTSASESASDVFLSASDVL